MQQRILIIEDNPADAAIINLYLEEAAFGHVLFQADSLRGGFQILRENEIHLVLLDLSLTDSIGFSTLEKYLAEFSSVPAIVMTGLNNDIVGVQCVRAGAQDFLVKGEFDSRALVKSVRHSMQRFQTQIKLRESALQLASRQKRIQEAQELAQVASWEMNMATHAMKWGDEMYRIFGVPSQALSLSLSDYLNYVYFDDKQKVEAFFTDAMKDEEIHKIEHWIVAGNRIKYLSVRAKVQFDQASGHLLLIGSAQDISDQTGAFPPRPDKKRDDTRWSKEVLTALGSQIQKPFFDSIGLAHLLQKTAGPAQLDLLHDFRVGMDDLWLHINNLLFVQMALTQSLSKEKTYFSTRAFFQNLHETAELQARRAGAGFQFTMQPDMPETIQGDEKKMTQICFNLFKCAFSENASPDTPLQFQFACTTAVPERPEFHFRFIPGVKTFPVQQLHAALEEGDSSQVIAPQFSAKTPSLAVSGALVRFLGGRYEIRETDGLCDMLEVWVPVEMPDVKTASSSDDTYELPALNILLIDDHALHRIAGRSVLNQVNIGGAVELAEDIPTALHLLNGRHFDLVLLDLQMPDTDGIEAFSTLKKHTSAPFIAVSPSPHEEEKAHYLSHGFSGYIAKPLRPDTLQVEIRAALQTQAVY
ncbi:MAG: response regulator [Saprospiraceae bacterium]|nr:response regulator [Saprospiraceae bacterium]